MANGAVNRSNTCTVLLVDPHSNGFVISGGISMNVRSLVGLGVVLLVVGCGPAVDPNRPKTYPVTGTVTYNGQPVSDAMVTFIGGERGAIGRTDESGQIQMTTFEAGDGALPGNYKVMISKTVLEGVPDEMGEGASPGEEPAMGEQKDLLPAKYKDANESGLTAEVGEGLPNEFHFELTD
jgi:hypothetical protein